MCLCPVNSFMTCVTFLILNAFSGFVLFCSASFYIKQVAKNPAYHTNSLLLNCIASWIKGNVCFIDIRKKRYLFYETIPQTGNQYVSSMLPRFYLDFSRSPSFQGRLINNNHTLSRSGAGAADNICACVCVSVNSHPPLTL